jgi:hypothetical protein
MSLFRRRKPAPIPLDALMSVPPFPPSELSRFHARMGDAHAYLLLPFELECRRCGAFFPTRALAAAPVAYSDTDLGPPTALQVASRLCPDCQEESR